MQDAPWNHNIHYHRVVLDAVPTGARRALDVGCGEGLLARQLAPRVLQVVGVDVDTDVVRRADQATVERAVQFVEGDAPRLPFPSESFDVVSMVAVLHHLPLEPTLRAARDLLRPGGVLVIVGLARAATPIDYLYGCVGFAWSRLLRLRHTFTEVHATVTDPEETLADIRGVARDVLPGATVRRRALFRYTLVWRRPMD